MLITFRCIIACIYSRYLSHIAIFCVRSQSSFVNPKNHRPQRACVICFDMVLVVYGSVIRKGQQTRRLRWITCIHTGVRQLPYQTFKYWAIYKQYPTVIRNGYSRQTAHSAYCEVTPCYLLSYLSTYDFESSTLIRVYNWKRKKVSRCQTINTQFRDRHSNSK